MQTEILKLIFGVVVVVMTLLTNHQTYSANILAFITDHSPSHCIIQKTLLKALVHRGHQVSEIRHRMQFSLHFNFFIGHTGVNVFIKKHQRNDAQFP